MFLNIHNVGFIIIKITLKNVKGGLQAGSIW